MDEEPARVLGPVGRGPNGIVYLAVRPDDDPQMVTIKVIDASIDAALFRQCLTETAALLDSLRHPCIPELLQVGTTSSGHAYVMAAYVPGTSLRGYINARKSDVANRARLAGRLCAAVADLHERGIVHGSLKPTNIVVTESPDGPIPFLLDTGVVPAIEYGAGVHTAADAARDGHDLHTLVTLVLGELSGVVQGTEPAAVLASMFIPHAD